MTGMVVVLVEPQLPANVGAAARAMLTMGLSELRIVDPEGRLDPERHPEDVAQARARASGAVEVFDRARICRDLPAALADCAWAVGTSARSRRFDWPLLSPREAAQRMVGLAGTQQVAAVFGRERSGLSNAELDLCQAHLHIPANPDYSSLNLAAAVQVVCYELRMASLIATHGQGAAPEPGEALATGEQMEGLFRHFEDVMIASEFLDPEQPKQLMRRVRRLFNRAGLEDTEIHLLRGMLKAFDPRNRRY